MHRMRSFIILLLSHSCLPNPQDNWNCPEKGVNTRGRSPLGDVTKVDSWEKCAAKCARQKDCELWTWVQSTEGSLARNCALMSAATQTVRDGNVISGVKTCQGSYAEKNIMRPNSHVEVTSRPPYNPTQTIRPPYNPPATSGPIYNPPATIYNPPATSRPTSKPKDCIERNITITKLKEIKMKENGIQSWEQCDEECRKESGCTYWTWMTKTAPREALICFLHLETGERRDVPITKKDIYAISGKPGAVDCQAQAEFFNSSAGVSVTTMFMVLYSIVVVLLLMAVCVYNIHSYVKRGKSS